jgi:hypothetical protein
MGGFMIRALALAALLSFSSCTTVPQTMLEAVQDPDLTLKHGATIGLMPVAWTSEAAGQKIDPLLEKQILRYFANELKEHYGYDVRIMDKADLVEEKDHSIQFRAPASAPEYSMIILFAEKRGTVDVPAQSFAFYNGANGYMPGYATYGSTAGHKEYFVAEGISAFLWTGAKQDQMVWRGKVFKNTEVADLVEKSKLMVHQLVTQKFPKPH